MNSNPCQDHVISALQISHAFLLLYSIFLISKDYKHWCMQSYNICFHCVLCEAWYRARMVGDNVVAIKFNETIPNSASLYAWLIPLSLPLITILLYKLALWLRCFIQPVKIDTQFTICLWSCNRSHHVLRSLFVTGLDTYKRRKKILTRKTLTL